MKSSTPRSHRLAAVVAPVLFAAGLTLHAIPAGAQTVRPVIAEYAGSARGRFELVNDTNYPMTVVLDSKSFQIDRDGRGVFVPLDNHIHLTLSSTSYRIPPKQSRFVFYEAKADRLPAWFVIMSAFTSGIRQSALNMQVQLPHTVYLFQSQSLTKNDIEIGGIEYDALAKRVIIEIRNTSGGLGRASMVEVNGDGAKATSAGFPLLPGASRRVEVPWNSVSPPLRATVRFQKFEVAGPVQSRRP